MGNEDQCIHCQEELMIWERIRSLCWKCNELATITYYDNDENDN